MEKTFDPYNTFKMFSDQWEKQANDIIHTFSNNEEFIKFSKIGTESQAKFMEMFNKNQERIANQLNIPTKTDVANIAKLTIQTEEKLDSLEEQIWKIQESVDSSNNEIREIVQVSGEIIKLSKQLRTDMTKRQKELRTELDEVKNELGEINSLKEELSVLKEILDEKLDAPKEQQPAEKPTDTK